MATSNESLLIHGNAIQSAQRLRELLRLLPDLLPITTTDLNYLMLGSLCKTQACIHDFNHSILRSHRLLSSIIEMGINWGSLTIFMFNYASSWKSSSTSAPRPNITLFADGTRASGTPNSSSVPVSFCDSASNSSNNAFTSLSSSFS